MHLLPLELDPASSIACPTAVTAAGVADVTTVLNASCTETVPLGGPTSTRMLPAQLGYPAALLAAS